jgi:hypothetical protein
MVHDADVLDIIYTEKHDFLVLQEDHSKKKLRRNMFIGA